MVLINVLIERVPGSDGSFVISFELQRDGTENSGKTETPVPHTLLLSLKVEGKELPTLTGLLSRKVTIGENLELQSSLENQENLKSENHHLREERDSLEHENKILKRTLMELQREPRVA
jgi:hypothetical protein